ncbi:hypothetical protein GPECTOR_26g587 [Gonium pectorale]|uniref:Ricin B lectin domain-containing protein n=1 Tax=Gonium pectorale TaxID=33097 RepID=A0A150GFT8_GONPE|nr:hypothetical protein GPECTOR_26g587 [Gonium pectorale]|eukprot:KXZ48684.1 hypothetical protein GPECTOR_26g587 [Gonium pectorale]
MWGDWEQQSYPCGKFFYNETSKKMEVVAMPMNSYMLRFESSQGSSGDDTALNGISMGCLNGVANEVEDGDGGDWTASASCPTGGYFVGAKMRTESYQGTSGDDTAANSIVFTCSNQKGTDTNAYSGLWGTWNSYTYCPGESYICGIQVRVEGQQGSGDDTALNGLRIGCCSFPSSNETAVTAQAMIYTGTNSGKSCLDISNNNQVAGTSIQQWTCTNTTAQYFTVSSTPTGAYTITTIPSGLCLAAKDSGTSDGTKIVLATCTSASNQFFAITPYGDGTYTLSPTHASSKCLDVSGASSSNGAAVQVFTLSLPTRQTTDTMGTGTTTGKCVDIKGGVQAAGTYIQQYTCNKTPAQDWVIVTAGTNVYQIKSTSDFCLTAQNAGTSNGTRITIETCVSGAKYQMWQASAGYQGGVALSPLHKTSMCLDISNASSADEAAVQCNGTKAQTFTTTLPVI